MQTDIIKDVITNKTQIYRHESVCAGMCLHYKRNNNDQSQSDTIMKT